MSMHGLAGEVLQALNVDTSSVIISGLGHSADFAHQFHIAYSAMVSGSCVFSGQPFNCAVSSFPQDKQVPRTQDTRVPFCGGCAPGHTLPFDHCKKFPDNIDVGSLVDYPRRHCGQNPITIQECFDDVKYIKPARVFLFRGTHDNVSKPGAVENTQALLAQMISDPTDTLKLVNDQPFPFVVPLNATPYFGNSNAAGYDGPGECLRHVYDAPSMTAGTAKQSNWRIFDQTEFPDQEVGFQKSGWVYIPDKCKKTEDSIAGVCKLVVRPDTCEPPKTFAPDVADFAAYAEANDMVLLHPCMGGPVNKTAFPHSPDIQQGKLDAYGQTSNDYVHQSAPHMRAIGKMVKRVLGVSYSASNPTFAPEVSATTTATTAATATDPPVIHTLPKLNIDRTSIMTAGCSNTGDFASQFHVAFSSLVTGSCIFSGMPFHCAVTRFPKDYMVYKVPSTAAGIHCPDCPANGTLIYDHCKNHPKWVDVKMLAEYARTVGEEYVDDPDTHLAAARVFAFGPTHDRCYQPPAMENVANFHRLFAKDPSQVKLVEDQPFPHTLPTNSTPYFNNNSNSTGAGYDGPGECLKHVFGHGQRLYPLTIPADGQTPKYRSYWLRMNVSDIATDTGFGIKQSAWLFVPPQCEQGKCKLLILPGGCNAWTDDPPGGGSDDDFARYGVVNDIVILKPCQGGPIDTKRFPTNHENLRGMVDVYGQLTADYATKKGGQMGPIGGMLKRILGISK